MDTLTNESSKNLFPAEKKIITNLSSHGFQCLPNNCTKINNHPKFEKIERFQFQINAFNTDDARMRSTKISGSVFDSEQYMNLYTATVV